MLYGSKLHIPPNNYYEEPYKIALFLTKKVLRILWKKFRRMDR